MDIVQFEVFGRIEKPSGATAGQVCKAWVSRHPEANPSKARVAVNVDNGGIWADPHTRAHYGLLHYRGHTCTWEFISVGGQEYALLIVS
jgi:hypothetical protein